MKQKTILVVDDDEDMLKILSKILGAQGMHVLTASGPQEAMKLLDQVPHVILTDLHMEPVDGFQFIRDVRVHSSTKKTPILVLSALNDFHSVKKAIALGVNDYVLKPLTGPILVRKIKKVLFHQDFLQWDSTPETEIEAEIEVEAQIQTLGETGYQILGPFKITPDMEIKIKSDDFKKLNLERFPQRASRLLKTYQSGGRFLNDVTFVGIDEEGSGNIRQFCKKRGHA